MNFVRIFVGRTSGLVRWVAEQSVPFGKSLVTESGPQAEVLDVHDVGFVVKHDAWTVHAPGEENHGDETNPSYHIWTRIGHHDPDKGMSLAQALDVLRAHPEMPKFYETPCTFDGIAESIRAKGSKAIPGVVRGWLATILPDHHVNALGLGRIPFSVLKAAARLHAGADPHHGDMSTRLERVVQRQSDNHAARRLARRSRKE